MDMFIKQSVFEKWIKKAYKYDALRIYKSEDDDLIIDTPNWTLGIRKDFITKEVKGALVKLVGRFTGANRVYIVWQRWKYAI